MPITEIDIELQTAPLAVTLEVQQGITSLSNIITTGYTAGHMLRIASGGGLEGRTPAQVLADIGGQAALTNYSTITALTGYPSTFPPTIGSGSGEAVAGNDSRLHAAATVSGNGITISGQQISLSIGTGANQVAAGNHTHTASDVGAVGYTAQAGKTDEEKATARANTGAAQAFDSGTYIKGSKLVVIGDSLVAASTIKNLHVPGVQPAIAWYSNDQIDIVSPTNRSVNGVAVGGTDSKEAFDGQLGVSQIAESVNLDSDAVLIELGANDLGPSSNNSYTYSIGAFSTYYLRNVNALLAAGKNVICALPVPGGSANAPGYGGPYNEGIAAITTRILSDTASLGVRTYDPRPDFETVGTPGLYNDAFGASDGVHMTPCGALHFGKQVAAMFASSNQATGAAIGRGATVNANPFNTSTGTQPALATNRYGETLLLTRARTDAITPGERFIDLTADIGTMTIGTGNSGLTYTRKTSSDKLIVTHFVASGTTRLTTKIRTQNVRGMKLIEVWPASNAGTITATAAQVKTAVEADATANAWVTVALVGDGSGLAANLPPLTMEVRTSAGLNVADASAPVAGDQIRACVELHKHPTAGWPVMPFFELLLRSNESSTLVKVESTQPTLPWPEPIGDKMTVFTPWVPFVTGQTMHAVRVFTLFFGTLSMSRLIVQKRTP